MKTNIFKQKLFYGPLLLLGAIQVTHAAKALDSDDINNNDTNNTQAKDTAFKASIKASSKLCHIIGITDKERAYDDEKKNKLFEKKAKELSKLIKDENILFNVKEGSGFTCLHIVIADKNLPCFNVLVKDARISTILNEIDSGRNTPLHTIALVMGIEEKTKGKLPESSKKIATTMCQKLLKLYPRLDILDDCNYTSFIRSIMFKNKLMFDLIVQHWNDTAKLKNKSRSERIKFYNIAYHRNVAPLTVAVYTSFSHAIEVLLFNEASAILNDPKNSGQTLLHKLTQEPIKYKNINDQERALKTFLDNVSIYEISIFFTIHDTKRGYTCLMNAAAYNRPNMVKYLLVMMNRLAKENKLFIEGSNQKMSAKQIVTFIQEAIKVVPNINAKDDDEKEEDNENEAAEAGQRAKQCKHLLQTALAKANKKYEEEGSNCFFM